jgi:hypothetical protein
MLLLQCALLLVGFHIVLARRMSKPAAAAVTVAIFVFPPTLATMGVIWKDCLMAGCLVCGFAGLTGETRRQRVVGLVALGFAAALRHNAFAAVIPLTALLSPWPARRGPWVRRGAGLAIGAGLVVAALLVNKVLTRVEGHIFHHALAPYDLVGTVRYADDMTDDEVRALLDGVALASDRDLQKHARDIYRPHNYWGDLLWSDFRFFRWKPETRAQRDALAAAWWRAVTTETGAYLKTRWRLFKEMLLLSEFRDKRVFAASTEDPFTLGFVGLTRHTAEAQIQLALIMEELGASWIFDGYPYVVAALALLVAMRRDRAIVALLTSGLAYQAGFFVVAVSADFRYTHWLATCVVIAIAARFASVWDRRSRPA